ncbi:MAG: quinol:cytochrome C oxidoreductase [Pirellulaceae bacterium]
MAANIPNDNITLPASWRGMAPILLAIGSVCIMLSIGLCFFASGNGEESIGWEVFCHSYLANYCYCLSICLGALFFVMVQHLVRAGWSASIRRIAELLAFTIPWWALLFSPVLVMVIFSDTPYLYPWNIGAGKGLSAIVENKLQFLNPLWFTIRVAVYFGVWIIAARYFFSWSRKQDESGDSEITLKLQKWAGPFIILFALSVNFGAFDIMMSTDPAWFSTIYGVYLFAASMLSFFATIILSCFLLQRSGRIEKFVNLEHFQDMSKFQFGFIVFWGYIAFSQFLLYWYGNIPEETTWYKHRMEHGWQWIGLLLIVFHFAIPFLGTMSRHIRRNKALMAFWAAFILCVHWLDMMFLIMPTETIPVSAMLIVGHLVCWAGMVSVFVGLFLMRVGETPIVAVKDPWLPDSLSYQVGP